MSDRLAKIHDLTEGELRGWHAALGRWQPVIPGERAALMDRARVLGVSLEGGQG